MNDNGLNTKGLTSGIKVCRAQWIWLRCFLTFEVGAKDISKEIIITLHLLVAKFSLKPPVEQQTISLCSLEFWTLFNLRTLLVGASNPPKQSSCMEDEGLLSDWASVARHFSILLQGLLSPSVLIAVYCFLSFHLVMISWWNVYFPSLLLREIIKWLVRRIDDFSLVIG